MLFYVLLCRTKTEAIWYEIQARRGNTQCLYSARVAGEKAQGCHTLLLGAPFVYCVYSIQSCVNVLKELFVMEAETGGHTGREM